MGLFGKKNKVASNDDAYVDMEKADNLPVAVAVDAAPATPKPANIQPPSPVISPNTAKALKSLPRVPTVLQVCPHCHKTASTTRIRTAPNWVTCLIGLVLLFLFWPVCWIPFVTDAMKKTEHYCQSCDQSVGTVEPFQDCCVKHRT